MPTTETPPIESAEDSLRRNYARGDFAFWSDEAERKWKEINPPKPQWHPHITGTYVTSRPCSYFTSDDSYGAWQASLECGRSYLVGSDVPMEKFIRDHRSALTAWQKEAFAWANEHPGYKMQVTIGRNAWEVYRRGEFVTFGLPHQDAGGERHYISRDGKSKILINVD